MLQILAALAVALCLLLGLVFTLVAAIGLLKLNGPMTRLHAPTKAGTLGTGSFLLASMIHSYASGDGAAHELLIMAFLFVTAPVTANFVARVNIHQRSCDTPPRPPGEVWSTLDVRELDQDRQNETSN